MDRKESIVWCLEQLSLPELKRLSGIVGTPSRGTKPKVRRALIREYGQSWRRLMTDLRRAELRSLVDAAYPGEVWGLSSTKKQKLVRLLEIFLLNEWLPDQADEAVRPLRGSGAWVLHPDHEYDEVDEELWEEESEEWDEDPESDECTWSDTPFHVNKEDALEYRNGDRRPYAELKEMVLGLSEDGTRPFHIGITYRPSSRTSYYRKKGHTEMVVLCRCEFYGSARTLERRIVRWAHYKGLSIGNTRNTPPGQKAKSFKWYRLYLCR